MLQLINILHGISHSVAAIQNSNYISTECLGHSGAALLHCLGKNVVSNFLC